MLGFEGDLSQVVGLPNPAAGANLSYTLPRSEYTRIRAVTFKLVTSAQVATRTVILELVDGSGVVMAASSSGFTQTATNTVLYTFGCDLNVFGANNGAVCGAPLVGIWMDGGQKLVTSIANIQTSDAISNVRLVVDQVSAPGQGIPQA